MAKKKTTTKKPTPLGPSWITAEYREHMASIGKEGGQSRSAAKRKASRRNLKKAMAAKFPQSAKHNRAGRAGRSAHDED